MATVNYLDKTDLHLAVSQFNLDPAAQNAVIAQLIADGLYDNSNPDDGKSVWVESDLYNGVVQPPLFGTGGDPTVAPLIQVLETQQFFANVQTDNSLKVIIDDDSNPGASLNVTGGTAPVFIALGSHGTAVTLNDHGADTVYSSEGNDTITGNNGADSLIAGTGNVSLTDLLSGHSTLVAGSGNDTLTGLQGDTFGLPSGTMVASGNDVYNIHDGPGNSTINLGTGADTVNFLTTAGNDVINHSTLPGSNGTDTIDFTGSSNHSLNSIAASPNGIVEGTGANTGDYTINFTDGQTVTLNGHTVSAADDAFVLKFDGTTVHLKGGS